MLGSFLDAVFLFPNLRYVELSSRFGRRFSADLRIRSLQIGASSLRHLLVFSLLNCSLLETVEIGRGVMARLDELRFAKLDKLASLLIGDFALNDGLEPSRSAGGESSEEERLETSSLDPKYKNKSLILSGGESESPASQICPVCAPFASESAPALPSIRCISQRCHRSPNSLSPIPPSLIPVFSNSKVPPFLLFEADLPALSKLELASGCFAGGRLELQSTSFPRFGELQIFRVSPFWSVAITVSAEKRNWLSNVPIGVRCVIEAFPSLTRFACGLNSFARCNLLAVPSSVCCGEVSLQIWPNWNRFTSAILPSGTLLCSISRIWSSFALSPLGLDRFLKSRRCIL